MQYLLRWIYPNIHGENSSARYILDLIRWNSNGTGYTSTWWFSSILTKEANFVASYLRSSTSSPFWKLGKNLPSPLSKGGGQILSFQGSLLFWKGQNQLFLPPPLKVLQFHLKNFPQDYEDFCFHRITKIFVVLTIWNYWYSGLFKRRVTFVQIYFHRKEENKLKQKKKQSHRQTSWASNWWRNKL